MQAYINHHSTNTEFSIGGLKLSVDPYTLVKSNFNEISSNMLEDMISVKFKQLVYELYCYYHGEYLLLSQIDRSKINNREVKLKCVSDYANFIRHILPLSNDSELYYDNLTDELKLVIDWANSLLRYSSIYDYKDSIGKVIDL